MATPSLLDFTPMRLPTARDRTQLITAVSQQLAWQQQSALHIQQQASVRRRTVSAVGAGRSRTVPITNPKLSPDFINLQYQIWSLQMGQQAVQKLSSPAEVSQLFQRDGIGGRLLILGEPGSGKTQTLLTLASDLLKQVRTSNNPVPVLLDLSDWNGETLLAWATAKLWQRYRVPENCGHAWLTGGDLTLLLDGFDNLETAQQRTCAAAIDAFLRGNMNQTMALCCRRQVMERSGITFGQFNGGVHLVPLVAQQVKDYTTGLNKPDVWTGIKGDKVLQQLARLPLLLNVLAESFDSQPVANHHELVQRYITHQLTDSSGKRAAFSARDTQKYLGWLAQHLEKRDRTFHIESLRPDALPDSQRWLYRLLVGVILGLITGFFGHPMLGLAVGLLLSQVDIEAYPQYHLSLASLNWGSGLVLLIGALIPGLGLALLLGGIAGFAAGQFGFGGAGFTLGGFIGLMVGLAAGCLFQLRSGLQESIQVRRHPNQDTTSAFRNLFLVLTLLGLLLFVGVNAVATGIGQPASSLLTPHLLQGTLATLLAFGLWASFSLQHLVIRALLTGGGAMPLNYAQFLNFAANQKLLQKVGGGYRFIHEQVREQFLKGQTGR